MALIIQVTGGKQLILAIAKLKMATVNDKTFLRPAMKELKTIFEAFGISFPDFNTLKHPIPVPKKRGSKPKMITASGKARALVQNRP